MKRILLFCSLFLLGMACSQEEVVPPKDSNAEEIAQKIDEYQTPGDHVVTAAEALSRAETILSRWETRSTPRVVKSCEYFVAKPATRSLADTIEVAFHLINYEDNGGFAMVAADERATDIYAYSDEGQLTAADFEQNPGLRIYKEIATETYQAEVRGIITLPDPWPEDDPIGPVVPTRPSDIIKLPMAMYNGELHFKETITTEYAGECIVAARWHQSSPYNIFTKPYVAGCSVIAATQIMSYHEHPNSYANYNFDWELIKAYANYISEDNLAPIQISRLNWIVGRLGLANYGYEDGQYQTTMSAFNTKNVLNLMGYTCSNVSAYSNSQIAQNVLNNKPVWVAGYDQNKTEGHAWVVDGCRYSVTNFIYYKTYPPYEVAGITVSSGPYHLHHNWGWKDYQYNNGYYLSNDLLTHQGMLYHMEVIYNITPNE